MEYYLLSQGLECNKEIGDLQAVVKFLDTCELMECKMNKTKFVIPDSWDEEKTASINRIIIPSRFDSTEKKRFVAESLAYMRPVDYLIDGDFTFVDVYLTVSGLISTNPIYTILGSFSPAELFLRFGRLGQWHITSSFSSLLDIYKSIISLSILKYGLLSPSSVGNNLIYTQYVVKDGILEALQKEYTEVGIITEKISPIAICRLYNLVSAGGGFFNERYPQLTKFLTLRKTEIDILYREERTSHGFLAPTHPAFVNQKTNVPIILEDESFRFCVACEQNIDTKLFPKCGHNVCVSCQYLLSTPACILCSSLYAPSIDCEEYINTVSRVIRHPQTKSVHSKIRDLYQRLISDNKLFVDLPMGIYRSYITDVKLKQRAHKLLTKKYIRKTK